MTSLIGDSFGLKRPPLCKLIKDILEEYPSGQIFKEIIQNADDARATDVKFFLDFRTFKTLPPELISTTTDQEEIVQQFSGPALLSYNNASFKKEDWENIQRLQQSGKAKNPHKVGKFGIGFNSVYHITDLPVILSQNYCGFIEPQEIAWKGETGKGFTLEELKDSFPAVLEPFHGICGFSKQNPSFKNMTLFRFPLRNKKSKLSNKSYTIDELRSLLDALKKEARYLLVFLRSVCSIEICQITESNTTELLFKVSLSERDCQSRKSPEKSLIKKVESTFKGQSQYSSREVIKDISRFKIEIVDNYNVTEHEWLVVNQVGSPDVEVMQLAEKQHVLPWVGTAISLNDNNLHSVGRIFCALPLPIEDQSPFFVHVNGTFAICNNRRSLKWEAQERKGDEESTWNKLLVEKCLFSCYFELVCKLMEQHDVDTSMVYKCWPDIKKTQDTPWYGLLAPFYQLLVKSSKAVHTWLSGGEWISIKEAIFVNDNLPVAVRNALMECSIKLVDIDDSCSQALKQYYQDSLTMLQPALVKFYLKSNHDSYCNGSKEDKFEILKYCLSDKTYNDLTGLQLLPLASGNFQQFYTKPLCAEAIFLSSSSYPSDLLPDLESKLVSVYNEDEQLHLELCLVSYSGCTQLTMLNTKEIANLISLGITSKWSSKQMSHFWHWLQKQNLSHFENKFLVQIKSFSNGTTGIAKLAKEDGVVYISQISNMRSLLTGLEKCGIKFADACAFPHLKHKDLNEYLYQFDHNQILDAMQSLNVASDRLSSHEAIALQNYFSNSDLGRQKRIDTICKIPMFKVLQQKTRVSVDFIKSHNSETEAIAMDHTYSCETNLLPTTVFVIDATENESSLIKKLNDQIRLLREAEFLQQIAFHQIHNKEFTLSNVVPFMISVLKSFDNQEYKEAAEQLTSTMRSLPFVEVVNSSRLEAPQNLFDPDNEILVQLYLGKHKFPSSCFYPYLSILRQCSLKMKVSANDINQILRSIRTKTVHSQTSYKTSDNNYKRAIAILKYLSQHCHLLNDIDEYNSTLTFLRKEARQYYWLPVSSKCPTNYPSCLAWKGSKYSNSLVSCDGNSLIVLTQNLSSSKLPLIAGSQVLFIDNVPSKLEDLGSQPSDIVPAVISHFNQVISNENNISGDILELISYYTYEYLFQNVKYCTAKSFSGKWIWLQNLSTFISSSKVAVAANPLFRLNLEPFIYLLPSNLLKFSDLFKKCGVPTEVTPNQILSVLHSIRNTSSQSKLNEDEAWSIVTAVLSWVAENINSKSNILVPIDDDSVYPQLFPFEEVTYTDNDMLHAIAKDSDEKYYLIHPKLSHLSSKLGLTPLSDHLDITEDVFDDAGQNEPLTTRLSNILKDYKDGLTIIKEMIQNADDAEATEVNILYDDRTHSTEKLLFKGMAGSHGPALIVHNNSVFKKEDFENITKLAGATKKDQPLKIGKFGVGFCSVYHITDVPSFVSGEWFYIFDPTLKHLKGVVHNESRPGKKVKYQSKFMAQSQQMAPYENIFEFSSSANYDGTIFRLPFRENASQISSTIYNEYLVQKLKEDLKENGSKLLIFLQNVKRITFRSLDRDELVIDISITCSNEANGVKKCTTICFNESEIEYWLVAHQKGNLKQDDDDKPGIASVACQLIKKDLCYKSQEIKGNLFCFLPLSSSSTGLPVHVNANFAVLNNRTGIFIEETPSDSRELWNMQLMKTIIPEAYCNLLKKLQEMSASQQLLSYEENFYSLWPLTEKLQVRNPWTCLISALMKLISDKPLFYSSSTGQWLTLAQSQFLPILFGSKLSDYCSFYKAASILKLPVVSLPKNRLDQLIDSLCVCMQITDSVFFQKFFSKIDLFTSDSSIEIRNSILSIMLSAIASYHEQYSKIVEELKTIPCIPTSPVGKELKPAHELVDPFQFQAMFDPEDGMFPLNCLCENPLTYKTMQAYLNLMTKDISWDTIIKSAKTIKQLFDSNKRKALERVKLIIKSIGTRARNECPVDTFKSIPFLPVLQKPDVYILPWKGSGCTVLTPLEIFAATSVSNLQKISFIAGTQKAIANTMSLDKDGCTSIPKTVLQLLEISSEPTIEDVLNHFNLLIELMMSDVDRKNCLQDEAISKHVNDICQMVYGFFEGHLENNVMVKEIEEKLHFYDNKPFIWTGKEFVTSANVSRNWKKEDGPYLYKLPNILAMKQRLQQVLSINDEFDINKLLDTLVLMHCRYKEAPLPCDNHEFTDILISELNTAKGEYKGREQIILVDQNYILRPSSELYYNDAEWLQVEVDKYHFLHKNMLSSTADSLGVKRIRSSFLDTFVNETAFQGSKFGQREDLTQRIRNILRDYPLNESFLKELLQNADDAKAKKVCVILDKRQHGSQTTLSKEWSNDLQGPAILVWNDKEFSEKDLEGIQKLGLGSKRDDDESIGQFGIGFNVVYHVTDCPSFITCNSNVLCVFDPHCKYVLGADKIHPGRQYDDLNNGFWEKMKDLRSCYLQDPIPGQPEHFKTGTLFRFPLRWNDKLVDQSLVIESKETHSILVMEDQLKQWVKKIEEALLFLNHITQFEYYVIESTNSEFKLKSKYEVTMSHTAMQCHKEYQTYLSEQSKAKSTCKSCNPKVFTYSLTLQTERKCEKSYQKWVIQQGIGDILLVDQKWQFIGKVLPKHGLAVPIKSLKGFVGKIFCFLPLPITSSLPLHINGQFVLTSDRRSLWHGENKHSDKNQWNNRLIKAIASSYTSFLTKLRQYVVDTKGYMDDREFYRAVDSYYDLFPYWIMPEQSSFSTAIKHSSTDATAMSHTPSGTTATNRASLNDPWLALAKDVFSKLWTQNCEILVSKVYNGNKIKTNWHKLRNDDIDAFTQAYFPRSRPSLQPNRVLPILKRLGMTLTCASETLYKHFKDFKPFIAKPEQTFDFYCKFHSRIVSCPTPIDCSPFKREEDFAIFLKYIMKSSKDNLLFLKPPYNLPLLLTADRHIRNFEETNKVLCSRFYDLFPESLSAFLHPCLLGLEMSPTYFLLTDDFTFSQVKELLDKNLPPELSLNEVFNEFNKVIDRNKLKDIWSCISEDENFSQHQEKIVRCWALLPSTSNSLYQSKSLIIPVLKNRRNKPVENEVRLYELLCDSLSIPLLDEAIHESAAKYCPLPSNYDKVFQVIYNQQCQHRVFEKAKLCENDIKVLLCYFSRTSFRNDETIKNNVKSIPIFMTVNKVLTSLLGKDVYLWPKNGCCMAGYEKWAVLDSVVFLEYEGSWRNLCGNDFSLLGKTPDERQIYCELIFPCFTELTDEERKQHLQHIKDKLIDNSIFEAEKENFDLAVKFINKLKILKCLSHNGIMLSISSFCDHTVRIFTTFSEHFHFLEGDYRHETWLEFFCKLGLQTTVNFDTFIKLAKQVEKGDHSELESASDVLFSYIFSINAEPWYKSQYNMSMIGDIRFVKTAKLKPFSWIKAPCSPPHWFQSQSIGLTKCNEAVVDMHSAVIWTIKPVITLHKTPSSRMNNVLSQLGVVLEPDPADVYQNIINISNTNLANPELFSKYNPLLECHDNEDKISIFEIITANIKYLHAINCELLQNLREVPCIPVLADGTDESKTVLVRPLQVLVQAVNDFVPYLHTVPERLYPIMQAFQVMGVSRELELKHINYMLKLIKDSHPDSIMISDPNELRRITKAIRIIYELLLRSNKEKSQAQLESLHLPTQVSQSHFKLVPTKYLVFKDSTRYKLEKLIISTSSYFLFKIPLRDNKLSEKEFCLKLPRSVRPHGFSLCCHETVLCAQQNKDSGSPLVSHFKKFRTLFPKIACSISSIIDKNLPRSFDEKESEKFVEKLKEILTEMTVTTINNLQVKVTLKGDSDCIGVLKVDYSLQKTNETYTLFVDEETTSSSTLWAEMAQSLCIEISRLLECDLLKFFKCRESLSHILAVQSINDMQQLVDVQDLDIVNDDEVSDDYKPNIGHPLPDSLVTMLSQDIDYIFRPQDLVGYELEVNYYIWAMILYPVMDDTVPKSDTGPKLKRYVIAWSELEEPKEVSSVYLHRFAPQEFTEQSTETALATYHGVSELEELKDSKELFEIKKRIIKELKLIWNSDLSDKEKKKAVLRMFLSYHPDKAMTNKHLYEEAFKFLQRQLDRLEKGLELEEPKDDGPVDNCEPSHWREYFTSCSDVFRTYNHKSRTGGIGGNKGRKGGVGKFDSWSDYVKPKPDVIEAKRWLRQANSDREAMEILLDSLNAKRVSCQVAFLAHEVVEKALKAGMYQLIGINPSCESLVHHKLTSHARAISSEKPGQAEELPGIASKMESSYLDTRFPNRHPMPSAPVDVYCPEQARRNAEMAETVYKIIYKIVNN
ncbi:PREDICTED: sacsin-like [Amphimedon queenslandica]|uniref:Uncharacterized protein n=1 Tax=Amphimedon queenslandica TaxID=400682 RepID=A0A1X7VWU1_AMPQE|nr:PREDICTED: sacsin-like [Amphimedon queenslandica]|eukprot:XP_003382551.1 PREDICTED: sacsin-like [Amphimedon queenslandica]